MIVCSLFIFVNPVLFLVCSSTFPHFSPLSSRLFTVMIPCPFLGVLYLRLSVLKGWRSMQRLMKMACWEDTRASLKHLEAGRPAETVQSATPGSAFLGSSAHFRVFTLLTGCSAAPYLLSQWSICWDGSNPDSKSQTHQLGFIIAVNKANFWTSRLEKSNLLAYQRVLRQVVGLH